MEKEQVSVCFTEEENRLNKRTRMWINLAFIPVFLNCMLHLDSILGQHRWPPRRFVGLWSCCLPTYWTLDLWPLAWPTCDLSALSPELCEWLAFPSQDAHQSQSLCGVSLIAIYCIYLSGDLPEVEINFSRHSSVYGFRDIWIAAARLRGSEEYVNEPPVFLTLLSFPLSAEACVLL